MAYKDLLLYLNSYPEVTSAAAIEQGVRFAGLLGARLSALTFEIDIRVPTNPLVFAILDVPGMIAAERSKSIGNARDLVNVFNTSAAKQGVPSDHIIERSLASHIPEIVTEYARLRDLTIIPVGEAGGFQRYDRHRSALRHSRLLASRSQECKLFVDQDTSTLRI